MVEDDAVVAGHCEHSYKNNKVICRDRAARGTSDSVRAQRI